MSTLGLYTTMTCRWDRVRLLVEAGVLPQMSHSVLPPFGF